MQPVHEYIALWKRWEARKEPWRPYWQQLGEVLLPNHARFTGGKTPGQANNDEIFDGSPRLAARSLITTIDGLLKDKTSDWFWITTNDEALNDDDEVKRWLEDSKQRMRNAIYRRQARFTQRSGEVDESLVVFGHGALFTGVANNHLNFRSFPIGNFAFDESADGEVDQCSFVEMWNAVQAIRKMEAMGAEPHADLVKLAKDKEQRDKKLPFVQLILPNDDFDPGRLDIRGKEYISVWIDVTHEHIFRKGGFDDFPVAVPRWDTSPGEIYARSPGMMALPDSKTLQAMGKTLLLGGQRAVDPPVWAYNEAMLSPVRSFPGGLTVIDATQARQQSGQPIGVLDMGKNIPLGREMQEDYRKQVEAAFFKNVFALPVDGPQMTATEVMERKEEFLRTIGPVFGRLETDYIGHIVERVFRIMMSNGQFAPAPEVFGESDATIKFEYRSPVQKARKQLEAAGLARGLELAAPIIQAKPETADWINGDEIIKDMPEWSGIPQQWITPESEVEEARAQRQQQIEAQQAIAAASELAPAAKQAADAAPGLEQLLGGAANDQAAEAPGDVSELAGR